MGADVAIAARRTERLEELAAEVAETTDADAVAVPTDVSVEEEVIAMVDEAVDAFGRLDVVVNNAGMGPGSPDQLRTDEFRDMMATNVDGTFFTTRAALPHLRATAGKLIYVCSAVGQYPRPTNPVYAASKWWVRGFAYSIAGRAGPDGIAVSVINATAVRSEFGVPYRPPNAERFDPGEAIEPEEVAEAIAFAARQAEPTTVHQLDLYRRDKLSLFG